MQRVLDELGFAVLLSPRQYAVGKVVSTKIAGNSGYAGVHNITFVVVGPASEEDLSKQLKILRVRPQAHPDMSYHAYRIVAE
jgi:hypothetical protein